MSINCISTTRITNFTTIAPIQKRKARIIFMIDRIGSTLYDDANINLVLSPSSTCHHDKHEKLILRAQKASQST